MDGILGAFITIFVIMNPVGDIPIFVKATRGLPRKEIRKCADSAVSVAGILLFLFLFLGMNIFNFFGIDMDSFHIAGGIILLIFGVAYVLGIDFKFLKPTGHDLSVPLGTPLLTGPGTIMTVIILVRKQGTFVTVIASAMALLATYLILLNSSKIYRFLGEQWTNVAYRIVGVILAAIAIGFIKDGALSILRSL